MGPAAALALALALLGHADALRPIQTLQTLGAAEPPDFCHDLQCPRYMVLKSPLTNGAELRRYARAVWVSTNVSNVSYDKAISVGFMRLFAYISGFNKDMRKIEMTAPVRTKLIPGPGPFCESRFKISFFVPFELQDSPPEPSAEEVFVEREPAHRVFVLSYGGFTNENKILKRASELLQQLDHHKLPYSYDHFFSAGYDSPFRILNRHNEIWIPYNRTAELESAHHEGSSARHEGSSARH